MCSEAEALQMFAVMGSDEIPIYIGSFDECDEFLRLSGIVPLEDVIVPLENDGVEVLKESCGSIANYL